MQLLKLNRGWIFCFLVLFLSFAGKAQEVIRDVKIEKQNPSQFIVYYSLKQAGDLEFKNVILKILRKRSGKVEEVLSESIIPKNVKLRPNQIYSYNWKTNAATVKAGDELQAKIMITYNKPAVAKQKANLPPTVDAGAFREVQLPVRQPISLNGSKSFDSDGKIVSVNWKQIAGPTAVIISPADSLVSKVTGYFKEGRYAFELTVKDQLGASSVARTIVLIKPAAAVVPKSDVTMNNKKNNTVSPPIASRPSGQKLKGGPVNALVNVALPGVGHYLVSGDPYGNNRRPATFIITAIYAGSIGGTVYFKLKSDRDYNKYLELANYREYQEDANGNIIGVRGAIQAEANKYLEDAKSANNNTKIFLGISAGILAGDLIYTFIKGMSNKAAWKNDGNAKSKIFISSNGIGLTAGVRIKL